MNHGSPGEAQAVADLAQKVRASRLPPPEERARIRREARASLRDFAAALGISPTTMQRWEAGDGEIRLDHAVAYAGLLTALRDAIDGADCSDNAKVPAHDH